MEKTGTILVIKEEIILENVSLDYPLDVEDGYSWKSSLLNFYSKARRPKQKSYRALSDISLKINKGEKVGLIGSNGAGKSTLLRLLSKIYHPSEGKVFVADKVTPILDFATGFEQHLTGIENVILRLMFLGETRKSAENKVKEIAKFADLEDVIQQQVRTYSAGMFIRLAFTTSTSVKPKILLVDEVIGAWDNKFSLKAEDRMRELIEGNNTVVMSSHSEELLRMFCQRLIWLEKGKVTMDGTVDEVLKAYNSHNFV